MATYGLPISKGVLLQAMLATKGENRIMKKPYHLRLLLHGPGKIYAQNRYTLNPYGGGG